MQGASKSTDEKVSRYVSAITALSQAESRVRSAECEVANASNDLIKHLLPKKPDEKMVYGIWVNGGGRLSLGEGDVLVRLFKREGRDWQLEIDKQGRTA